MATTDPKFLAQIITAKAAKFSILAETCTNLARRPALKLADFEQIDDKAQQLWQAVMLNLSGESLDHNPLFLEIKGWMGQVRGIGNSVLVNEDKFTNDYHSARIAILQVGGELHKVANGLTILATLIACKAPGKSRKAEKPQPEQGTRQKIFKMKIGQAIAGVAKTVNQSMTIYRMSKVGGYEMNQLAELLSIAQTTAWARDPGARGQLAEMEAEAKAMASELLNAKRDIREDILRRLAETKAAVAEL